MTKFDGGAALSALEFDFTTIPGWSPDYTDAKGTIPEPSTEMVDRFLDRYFELMALLADVEGAKADEIENGGVEQDGEQKTLHERLEAWRNGEPKNAQERAFVQDALLELTVYVTQGTIKEDWLRALGYRGQRLFTQWLVSELADPKGPEPSAMTS